MSISIHKYPLISLSILFFVLFFISKTTFAATRTWNGGGITNNWSEANNWSGNVVPGSSDDVVFSASSTKNSVWDSAGPAQIITLNVQSNYSGNLTLARDISVSRDWTFAGSGSLIPQTSTLKFVSYSSSFTPGSVNYYNIEVAKNSGSSLTVSSTAIVTNNLTISGTNNVINIGAINVSGDIAITATSNGGGGNGTINIVGTGDQNISSSGGYFPSIAIDKPSGILYLSGVISISGNWTWQSGIINPQTSTLKFVSAYITNFTPGPLDYYNLEIKGRDIWSTVYLRSDVNLNNNLNITIGNLIQTSYNLRANNAITVNQNTSLQNYSTSTSYIYVGSGGVFNNGFIDFNGGSDYNCAGADTVLIRSTSPGTKRSWSGSGTFRMRDVDVKDQGGTADIVVAQGTNSGNNGSNWSFDNNPLTYIYKANLTSSFFDSQIVGGASLNSIMFTTIGITLSDLVKFQIASSNASSGPWSFMGPDGTNSTYYIPHSNGTYFAVPINPSQHNNKRYFRYKIFLETDYCRSISPKVKGVIINWSM